MKKENLEKVLAHIPEEKIDVDFTYFSNIPATRLDGLEKICDDTPKLMVEHLDDFIKSLHQIESFDGFLTDWATFAVNQHYDLDGWTPYESECWELYCGEITLVVEIKE